MPTNRKLIIRAAIVYRNWMIKQAAIQDDDKTRAAKLIQSIASKSEEIKKFGDIFFWGSTERKQGNHYDGTTHTGIVNLEVYKEIANYTIPDLCQDISMYADGFASHMKSIVAKPIDPISLRKAVEEIWSIFSTWKIVEFRDKLLSVLIENVVLNDEEESVDLGNFWVHLNLTNMKLTIDSVNEILSSDGYSHPHVAGHELCTGDGHVPLEEAISQGRLEDCFRIVESILRTYNDESPYEKLCGWYNPDHEGQFYCEICDEWRDNEDMILCPRCGMEFCDSCANGSFCKECDSWICEGCIVSCEPCSDTLCEKCAKSCYTCRATVCESCLSTCDCCENDSCDDCMNSTCVDCGISMCDTCVEICDECGTNMCKTCSYEHNCLLASTDSE